MCQIATERLQESDPARALPPNWEGFRFNDRGELTTRSGYRCSPQSLEAALWLLGCWSSESRQYLIRSDEARSAVRPLYETSDADDTGQVQPTRLKLVEDQKRVSGGALEVPSEPERQRRDITQSEPVTLDQDQERARTERGRQTSAAIEPPLQRLRRAAAGQIMFTTSDCEDGVAGATAPTQSLGAFPLI